MSYFNKDALPCQTKTEAISGECREIPGETQGELLSVTNMQIDVQLKPKTLEESVVDELNEKHAVMHTSQFYILTEKPNPEYPMQTNWFLESRESLRHQYENKKVVVSSGGSQKVKTKADIWLKSPRRRTYNGIVFDVGTTSSVGDLYNVFKGFAVVSLAGSCELLKKHILENICNGSLIKYNYLMNWVALLIQRPQERGTAIVLMGKQGTGKGVFVNALGRLLGKHFSYVDNLQHVLGHFNSHLKDALLTFCDEAVWGGHKKDIGRLKSMVTEKIQLVEQKGKDVYQVLNFNHFIFASNEDWPLHLDADDRRFCVFKISDAHKEDRQYFRAIMAELESGGYQALLYELQHRDLSGFDIHDLPVDNDSFDVKLLSAPSVDQYLFQALQEESFDLGNLQNCGVWSESIPTRVVYNDYCLYCKKQGWTPESIVKFGLRLKNLLPNTCERSRTKGAGGSRSYIYKFSCLREVRKDFEKLYKESSKIWDCS